MDNTKKTRIIQLSLLAVLVAFSLTTFVWGHGEGTRIVPASLTVKAGSELKVTVNGLADTKTARLPAVSRCGRDPGGGCRHRGGAYHRGAGGGTAA